MTPRYMTMRETSHYTSFGKSTLYADAKIGLLRLTKFGRATRVALEDADAYLDAKAAAEKKPPPTRGPAGAYIFQRH